ncbi:MAG: carbohydrate-binding domain-containing protein [Eubacteriaceae bacterium]|nr:carbohydrate-binding domain-containing protein [Eubacteriaceae bacterium]
MKKILIFLIALVMVLPAAPSSAAAADATGIWFLGSYLPPGYCCYVGENGLDYVSSPDGVPDGEGYVYWDAQTSTVTVHNMVTPNWINDESPLFEANGSFTLVLEGDSLVGDGNSRFKSPLASISGGGTLTVKGEGSLTFVCCNDMDYDYIIGCGNPDDYSSTVYPSLSIEGGTLTIDALGSYIHSVIEIVDYEQSAGVFNVTLNATDGSLAGVMNTDRFSMSGGNLRIDSGCKDLSHPAIKCFESFGMSGGDMQLKSAGYGITMFCDASFSGGTVEVTGRATAGYDDCWECECAIWISRGFDLTVSGGSITIPGGDFEYGIRAEYDFDQWSVSPAGTTSVRFTGGSHDITGYGSAADIDGDVTFESGTVRLCSEAGPAIVTTKGIFLEGSAAFTDTSLRVIGVADLTASIVPAGSEAMWSVYDRELDADIGTSAAAQAAVRELTVKGDTVPEGSPDKNPSTGIPSAAPLYVMVLTCAAAIYAARRRQRPAA